MRSRCVLLRALLLGVIASVLSRVADSQTLQWVERTPNPSPEDRCGHGMAFDSNRGRTVLYGGTGSHAYDDTWEWDGARWELVASTGPGLYLGNPLHQFGMTFDSGRGVTVLFGGSTGYAYEDETFEWDGTLWRHIDVSTRPSALRWPALAYDSRRGRTLLFGGQNSGGGGTSVDDTWEWDGSEWEQKNPALKPQGRHGHGLAYDTRRGVVVLFGGQTTWLSFLDDTWEWDGVNWERRDVAGPSARGFFGMEYDDSLGVTIVYGGVSQAGPNYETWTWDGERWVLINPGVPPAAAVEATLSYDSRRKRSVLFGGGACSGCRLGETWELVDPTVGVDWVQRFPIASPPAMSAHVMAHDSSRDATMLYGGRNLPAQLWEWNGRDEVWTECLGCGRPEPHEHAMAFDSSRNVLVYPAEHGHTFEWDGLTWLFKGVLPTGQTGTPGMAYDSARGLTVLFGGHICCTGGYASDRTFEWDGASWSERSQGPPGRGSTAMVYDSARGVCVLFGGKDSGCWGCNPEMYADTWEWDGTTWANVTPPYPELSPPPRFRHAMVYDSRRGVTVLFGGLWERFYPQYEYKIYGDTWEWNGEQWIEVTSSPSPSARYDHAMTYDSGRGETILFGGVDPSGVTLADTWVAVERQRRTELIHGHVLFEDGKTPVPYSNVQLYTHPGHKPVGPPAVVDPNDGSFSVTVLDGLAPGEYDAIAISAIPPDFYDARNPRYEVAAWQPLNTDPVADIIVDQSGIPSQSELQFRFRWPAILLHGITLFRCQDGRSHFETLQPYLASDLNTALTAPRDAIIPLVPELNKWCAEPDLEEYYEQGKEAVEDLIYDWYDTGVDMQLVGYSQGGLTTRQLLDVRLLNLYPVAIRTAKVIQIGTPNDGTCVADYIGNLVFLPWMKDLGIREMFSFNEEHSYSRHPDRPGKDIPFYLIAGTNDSLTWPWDGIHDGCLQGFINDGVVAETSVAGVYAKGYNVQGFAAFFANHFDLPHDQAVMIQVRQWLLGP